MCSWCSFSWRLEPQRPANQFVFYKGLILFPSASSSLMLCLIHEVLRAEMCVLSSGVQGTKRKSFKIIYLSSRIPLAWQVIFSWNCRFLLFFLLFTVEASWLEEQSDQQTFLFPFVSARHKNSCQAGYLQLSLQCPNVIFMTMHFLFVSSVNTSPTEPCSS